MSKRYENLGVSASKDEIHKAIEHLDRGLYSNSFCKVLADLVGQDNAFGNIIHADTAGSKTALAYLYWKETGDLNVWEGIAQDALVMNIDDLACSGAANNIIISSTIGRNKHIIPGSVIEKIIHATDRILKNLQLHGINIYSGGGETADVGDIVRTIDVGITAFARIERKKVINIDLSPDAVIVGFASYGMTSYESEYNSGIGSNGLTAARHDVLHKTYLTQYPESVSPETNPEYQYTGNYKLTDRIDLSGKDYEVGKLLLSPTRTYLPLIQRILSKYYSKIQGIIHCTGGAQTKVKKFINNRRIVKNKLFPVPPVFELLQNCSLCTPREMYEVYNMGHRLEIYTDKKTAHELIEIAREFNIEAQIIGHVEAHVGEEVLIDTGFEVFSY